MHTHNVNVKTATEESSRKIGGKDTPLTDAQIIEIFNWVFAVTADMPGAQCHDFIPPEGTEELNVFEKCIPDYCSVWIRNGWPVAAALPLDSLFRVLPD
ncbi:hypothetical protein SAMN03159428_04881 [Kosakonia radicincitans]|uniref:Uncharacterized protein n=1 Tax=Kosakonia radicincitans TaxID=283686 RepID=A0AAX2EZC1_9ENTR|nr:hypothetical protein [Kosakonia radicincitans]SFF37453.1 hypothetical protein SAMN03159468_04908 [Kosakonia radicincitans]SFR26124.1 hypothetical protein SAMN03159514_04868 [Kosakonia radicincitans]SFU16534.1 hypothetical protein SAMN03159428_04881 [Kosakonia radicincitans]SFY31702.1 hypothetical protein SAMN03159436_04858 [Kosakonia radicincitans]